MIRKRKPIANRFWERVERGGSTRCWIWRGLKNSKGYGKISEGGHCGRMLYAHRVSYELTHGPITDGLFVCHRCDNPSCVNPDHLFLGTHKDNMADCRKKGRTAREKRLPHTKLTDAQVLEIRASREHYRIVAARYGVTPTYVCSLRSGLYRSEITQ